jgi:hypothetical protein
MQFRCEDLRDAGVVLVPVGSPEFSPLLADIKRHLESPPAGSRPPLPGRRDESVPAEIDPTAAILWNQSGKPISAWTLIWKYEEISGHQYSNSFIHGVGTVPSLLLPFGLNEDRRPFITYWQIILPGSKRYVSPDAIAGTNADVRPPAPEERWSGGIGGGGGGARGSGSRAELRSATLVLDAAFFADGECAGPDERQLWDQVVGTAELYRKIAATAREGLAKAISASDILVEIERITGPAGGPPPYQPATRGGPHREAFRGRAERSLARMIGMRRTHQGDDKTVAGLADWANTVLSAYRRI